MKKLQVKTATGWAWVFGRNKQLADSLITTETKSKALPPMAMWAKDDLEWASKVWFDREFRLAETLEQEKSHA